MAFTHVLLSREAINEIAEGLGAVAVVNEFGADRINAIEATRELATTKIRAALAALKSGEPIVQPVLMDAETSTAGIA